MLAVVERLIGWQGGPQDYSEQHGHPRLRMHHSRVAVDTAMRDAWLRCMTLALDGEGIAGPVRVVAQGAFASACAAAWALIAAS